MSKSVLVTATQRGSGKSMVALGLVNLLEANLAKVGFFKPIGQKGMDGMDPDVRLLKESLGLDFTLDEMVPVTMDDVSDALARGTFDQLMDRILEAFEHIADQCDFVVCEGTDYFGTMAALEFNINADLSKNLASPILLVANAAGSDANCIREEDRCDAICDAMVENISLIKESLDEQHSDLFGVIVNRVTPQAIEEVRTVLEPRLRSLGVKLLGTIPRNDMLAKLRVEEIAAALGAEVLSGRERLNVLAQDVKVAAMSLENVLARVPRGALLLVPGDREDLLIGLAAAYMSPTIPSPAGIVMTGGLRPRENVEKLFLDLTESTMPVLRVDSDTYETAIRISQVEPTLAAHQRMRIEVVKSLVERHVDVEELLASSVVEPRTSRITPKQFIHRIVEMARKDRKRIVLPEGKEPRILKAAEVLLSRGVADLTLLGDQQEIERAIARLGLKLDPVQIVDPARSEHREPFARRYMELRAKKNPTWELAFDLMADPTYFGTMMVQEGLADGMVSGSITTTAATLRPALEFIKTREGILIASSVFFMCLPDQVLVYGDCAVNPNPTAEQLASIALASAETAKSFGITPYVAMLSYSTGTSGTGSDVEKVRKATELVRKANPALPVEGPIQYDAAIDPTVARTKLPGSRVAGSATVFIFPDLNSGNNTYKAVQRAANAIAIGPVMQGLRKPVNDLSRGCTIPDIINTVAITCVQAQRS